MQIQFYSAPTDVLPWHLCTGHNVKGTLVLVVQSDIPAQLTLLKKILRAINLDFDTDISFLAMEDGASVQLLADPKLAEFQNVLTFGLRPANIGFPALDERFPAVFNFETLTCLWSPSLSRIGEDAKLKKQLWNALKDIFEPAGK